LKPIIKQSFIVPSLCQTLLKNKISQRYIECQFHTVLSVNESITNTSWNIGEKQ